MKENKRTIRQIMAICVIIIMCGNISMTALAETNLNEYTISMIPNDVNLTGKWTYVDNTDNNPIPVLIAQGEQTWTLAIYQGTKVSLGMNDTYMFYELLPVEQSNCVTIRGTLGEIEVEAMSIGTEVVTLPFIDIVEEDERKVSKTQMTLIVNVVPAQPNTGNGIWTNDENNRKIPDYLIEQKFQQITSAIFNDSMSDYQKVKATWDWMIENITYDHATALKDSEESVKEKSHI